MTFHLFSFDKTAFNRLFPFYIAIDRQLQITSCGESIAKLLHITIPSSFSDRFIVRQPATSVHSINDLRNLINHVVELEAKGAEPLNLKGQFEYLEEKDTMLFLGSPRFRSVEHLKQKAITISDFASHDHLIDLLYLLQTQEVTNTDLQQLASTVKTQKEALKKANKAIREVALFPLQNPDPLIRIDFSGNIITLNPTAKGLLHFIYEHESYTQEALFKKIIPLVDKEAERWTFEAMANDKHYSFVCKTLMQDGYINIYGRDITQQKKSEDELKRLSLVASANKNGILFLNKDKTIFWCNEGFSQITGYTQAETLGKRPMELTLDAFADSTTLPKMEKLFEANQSFNIEGQYHWKKNYPLWVRIQGQPISDEQKDLVYYFITIEDITEEKLTQHKLKEYEKQLKLALSNVGDNYFEHDFDAAKTTFSNPTNQFLGYGFDTVDDAVNFWLNRTHVDDRERVGSVYYQYLNKEIDSHTLEYRMEHQDGSIHWILDRGFIVEKDETGRPLRMVGTHIDITQHKQLEIQLTAAKEAAEASTRSKETFLTNMSHEIRTPMNAIIGMMGQLARTTLDSSQQFYLNTIQSAADNLLVIINDILDLSKIEAGKLSLEQIGFEIGAIINRVMQVMMQKAVEKGLLFTNSFLDTALHPVLIGDPYRLNQILLNFISNAIKFTEKGKVDIGCYVVSDTPDNQTIKLQIVDTGIGMTPAFVQNLFHKFTQEDESVTRRFGGSGLGLSICKQLIDLMNGQVTVESEKGKGTTISIVLDFPKGTKADLPIKVIGIINSQTLAGKKILVADDNEMNRAVAQIILENYGAQVTVAVDGQDALMKATTDFDIILMDIQMPEMDGFEASSHIRKKIGADIPIVALTATSLKSDKEKIDAAGMQGYLLKPFEEMQLLSTIATYLNITLPTLSDIEGDKKTHSAPLLYSLNKLNNITRGDQVFTQKLLKLFMEQAPVSVSALQEAYQQGNFTLVQKIAHRLIASVDNMGIAVLKSTIREIEKNATLYKTSSQLEALINHVDDVIKKVLVQLQDIIIN